ncbi:MULTISPECIES: Crp/Fnr family transcriptional regulator [Chryseobacterium]|uniref:Crp/Fnr family transcriptional regulator n=1 Tax=Chryseobacterium TaxID=59732 RepID=UPI00195B1576|nr:MULTISPECIES: Crp/Fnr family transcriptional regulator [Chryseobacterium]MBM7420284.1 CRP-like cAMP-binding protein [Chryseobacterium sp. JUb44]MDH6210228.1 CRP-like cAMP-binding protein [Chryseobacterium sp. BIGb0186]WSO08943.1 Crp/Fnr family transcriptional regulator [Chryseobacterium scophthalmum]
MISKFIFNNQYLFEDLPQYDKETLQKVMQVKNYRKNEAIFTEGTIPNGIFFLKNGKVKKYKVDNDGREQIIYIYNAGEFFGYSAILSNDTYGDTTLAIENSVIAFISKENFLKILDQSDFFSKLLLKSLSHEFSVMANLMTVLSQRTVRERVALSLLILHRKYKSNIEEDKTYITLSRTDLANMVGTANETLARILHDFREDHLIVMEGRKILLIDLETLTRIANI